MQGAGKSVPPVANELVPRRSQRKWRAIESLQPRQLWRTRLESRTGTGAPDDNMARRRPVVEAKRKRAGDLDRDPVQEPDLSAGCHRALALDQRGADDETWLLADEELWKGQGSRPELGLRTQSSWSQASGGVAWYPARTSTLRYPPAKLTSSRVNSCCRTWLAMTVIVLAAPLHSRVMPCPTARFADQLAHRRSYSPPSAQLTTIDEGRIRKWPEAWPSQRRGRFADAADPLASRPITDAAVVNQRSVW